MASELDLSHSRTGTPPGSRGTESTRRLCSSLLGAPPGLHTPGQWEDQCSGCPTYTHSSPEALTSLRFPRRTHQLSISELCTRCSFQGQSPWPSCPAPPGLSAVTSQGSVLTAVQGTPPAVPSHPTTPRGQELRRPCGSASAVSPAPALGPQPPQGRHRLAGLQGQPQPTAPSPARRTDSKRGRRRPGATPLPRPPQRPRPTGIPALGSPRLQALQSVIHPQLGLPALTAYASCTAVPETSGLSCFCILESVLFSAWMTFPLFF